MIHTCKNCNNKWSSGSKKPNQLCPKCMTQTKKTEENIETIEDIFSDIPCFDCRYRLTMDGCVGGCSLDGAETTEPNFYSKARETSECVFYE